MISVDVNGCRHLLLCDVARPGHTLLDVDQPLCHLGLSAFLCHLLTSVGRHHLVRSTLHINTLIHVKFVFYIVQCYGNDISSIFRTARTQKQ